MILFLLRLLLIVVVAAIFLVLLSRKLSGTLRSSSQRPAAEPAVVPYYAAKREGLPITIRKLECWFGDSQALAGNHIELGQRKFRDGR